jgi:hypothetical protein
MTHSQDHDLFTLKSVERDVPTSTEGDNPFPKLWVHVFCGAPGARLLCQYIDVRSDGLDGFSCGRSILFDEKPVQAINVTQRCRRPD